MSKAKLEDIVLRINKLEALLDKKTKEKIEEAEAKDKILLIAKAMGLT